jgi:predicted GIY-YIG superfamily endonuclease
MSQTSAKVWFLYMLRCADGSLYTGITNDLQRRCQQHNAGKASRYTRSRLPTRLVYQEVHASRSLALRREAAIKALSRQKKEVIIRQWEEEKLVG